MISYVLPEPYETRLSTRQSAYGGSLRHNHTRWRGEVFQKSIQHYIVSLLEMMGYDAVAPRRAPFFEWANTPEGVRGNWSERHVAYGSGLGTFGLNGLLITPKGCAHYLGSVVCDVALTPTPRPYNHYMAYCLSHRYGTCRKCMKRCLGGAISEQGHSNIKCRQYIREVQPAKLEESVGLEGLIGMVITCGLCWSGVPCEDRIPQLEVSG